MHLITPGVAMQPVATVARRGTSPLRALAISSLVLAACALLAPQAQASNLIANPSFESSTSGWGGWQANVSRVPASDAPNGSYVARVNGYAFQSSFSVSATTPPVAYTVAGTSYSASAMVRAATNESGRRPVRLVLVERTKAGANVRVTQSAAVLLGSTYQRVSASATAVASGNTLTMYVAHADAFWNHAFLIDAISLTASAASTGTSSTTTATTATTPAPAPTTTTTTTTTNTTTPTPAPTSTARYFSPTSFWNVPVPANAPSDANSANMISHLRSLVASSGAYLGNSTDWAKPVYEAKATDPMYQMRSWMYPGEGEPYACRVPASAMPSRGSDGHMIVIQPDGSSCDMWMASRWFDGTPLAATVRKSCGTIAGSSPTSWGTMACRGQNGGGAVAAGYAAAGGLVTPAEMKSGNIPHALFMAIPLGGASAIAWPATASDGHDPNPNAMPQGARIQLDPSYDVAASSYPAWKKTILRALQQHGAFLGDTGGVVSFAGTNAFNDAVWRDAGVPDVPALSDLPWDRMRVVQTTPKHVTPSWFPYQQ
jgi:hypothetical protein